jgi:uncharacterized protein
MDVRVIPRAGRTMTAGIRDGALLVRLAAPPVDGAANDALIAFLATILGQPKRDITIVSGAQSRSKRVRVARVTAAALRTTLSDAGTPDAR